MLVMSLALVCYIMISRVQIASLFVLLQWLLSPEPEYLLALGLTELNFGRKNSGQRAADLHLDGCNAQGVDQPGESRRVLQCFGFLHVGKFLTTDCLA